MKIDKQNKLRTPGIRNETNFNDVFKKSDSDHFLRSKLLYSHIYMDRYLKQFYKTGFIDLLIKWRKILNCFYFK